MQLYRMQVGAVWLPPRDSTYKGVLDWLPSAPNFALIPVSMVGWIVGKEAKMEMERHMAQGVCRGLPSDLVAHPKFYLKRARV